jgi:predicted ATPase/DNA-binding SARP family transcriptional activator
MHVRLLGSLSLELDEEPIRLGGSKQRTVLALLAVENGSVVSTDRLIEAAWGDDLPANPANTLQYQIAQLRKLVEVDPSQPIHIITEAPGYRLNGASVEVDAVTFEKLLRSAQAALDSGNTEDAHADIDDALLMWRGPALDEFRYDEWARAEAVRLDELHTTAKELRIDVAFAQGRHGEVVADLERLVSQHPLRERLWEHLMEALYVTGRPTDALRAFQRARDALGDVGVEPSEALTDLEIRILEQDPDLSVSPVPERSYPTNLPSPPNELVGRDREMDDVADRLTSSRIVTLVGPGGAGKTRLATAAARSSLGDYPGGAWLVRLDVLEEPELIGAVVAESMGIRENPDLDVVDTIARSAGGRSTLIVMDNCEHLVDEVAPFVEHLVSKSPSISVLATSQVTLDVSGEAVIDVPPLALPGETESIYDRLDDVAAVTLFVQRATDAGTTVDGSDADSLAAVANIVSALDGMPLAVELAAARTRSMSLGEIAEGLKNRFEILGRGPRSAPARQRSLAGAMDWSLSLLAPDEREAVERLSVFVGGFDTEAAAAVTGTGIARTQDLLATLVDRSLLRRVKDVEGAARFMMLETMREYAGKELTDPDAVRTAHLVWYANFIERASLGICGADQISWLNRFAAEYENIRAALGWSIESGRLEIGIRMGSSLGRYWDWRGMLKEASEWLLRLSSSGREAVPELAIVYGWRAFLAWEFGDAELAQRLSAESNRLASASGDLVSQAYAESGKALIARTEGNLDSARHACERIIKLSTEAGDPWMAAWAHSALATIELVAGDLEAASMQATATIDQFSALGDRHGVAWGLVAEAQIAQTLGDLNAAERLATEALDTSAATMDDRNVLWTLEILAHIALSRGETERAAQLWGATNPLRTSRGLTSSPSKREELTEIESRLLDELPDAEDMITQASIEADQVIARERARAERR